MPEYYVPEVIDNLTSKRVLTAELIEDTSLDKIENVDQETINKVLSSEAEFHNYFAWTVLARLDFRRSLGSGFPPLWG